MQLVVKSKILPWVVCFSASLFFAYELLQLHVMNAIAPMVMRDFQLSGAQFGALSATYLLADVAFLLPAGMILDRFSVRKVIMVALLLCILGTIGLCRANSFALASCAHFLSGIGNAFCFLSCMILITRWFPKERQAFVMGLMVTVGMCGGVIAQVPFSLLAQKLDWRGALLVDALVGMLILGVIFAFVKERPEGAVDDSAKGEMLPFWTGIKQAFSNIQTIFCGLYTCFLNLPLMIISAVWGTLFLTQVHHLQMLKASMIVSMICIGTIVGSPIYGWVSDKMGNRKGPMFFGAVTSTLVIVAILLVPLNSEALLTVLFFALGFFTSSQVIGYPVITESSPKHLTGTSMGVAAVIIMGMPAALQPITGRLLDWGWDGTMVDGVPFYSMADFAAAFSIFPIGFLISLIILGFIKETGAARKVLKAEIEKLT